MKSTSEYIIDDSSTRESVIEAHAQGLEIVDEETKRPLTCLVCPSCHTWVGDKSISKDVSEHTQGASIFFHEYDCLRCSTCASCKPDCIVRDLSRHTTCAHGEQQCRCQGCRESASHITDLHTYLQTYSKMRLFAQELGGLAGTNRLFEGAVHRVDLSAMTEIRRLERSLAPFDELPNISRSLSESMTSGLFADLPRISAGLSESMTSGLFADLPRISASLSESMTSGLFADLPRISAGLSESMTSGLFADLPRISASLSESMTSGLFADLPRISAGLSESMTSGLFADLPRISASLSESMTSGLFADLPRISAGLSESMTSGLFADLPRISAGLSESMTSGLFTDIQGIDRKLGLLNSNLESSLRASIFESVYPLTAERNIVPPADSISQDALGRSSSTTPSEAPESSTEHSRQFMERRIPFRPETDYDTGLYHEFQLLRETLSRDEWRMLEELSRMSLSRRIHRIRELYQACRFRIESQLRNIPVKGRLTAGIERIVKSLRTAAVLEWLWEKILWLLDYM